MKDEHILLSTDGPDCNVLKMKPPMLFNKNNVDKVVATLDRILKEVDVTDKSFSELKVKSKEPRAIKKTVEHEQKVKSI